MTTMVKENTTCNPEECYEPKGFRDSAPCVYHTCHHHIFIFENKNLKTEPKIENFVFCSCEF
jgi:hypothetical protein